MKEATDLYTVSCLNFTGLQSGLALCQYRDANWQTLQRQGMGRIPRFSLKLLRLQTYARDGLSLLTGIESAKKVAGVLIYELRSDFVEIL